MKRKKKTIRGRKEKKEPTACRHNHSHGKKWAARHLRQWDERSLGGSQK
jgi:hypothetical protein